MNQTRIEWTDSSWNPVTGCLNTCEYCYARKETQRFGGCSAAHSSYKATPFKYNGVTLFRYELEERAKKYDKNNKLIAAPFPLGFEPTLHRYRLNEPKEKITPQTIFVCSMADLFGDWVPDDWIQTVFDACKNAPQHRYMFLTKNPKRYRELFAAGKLPKESNFWYGITATNQVAAETAFRNIPNGWDGYNLFLSAEPLQGEINVPALESWPRLVILGAETGNRKDKILPTRAQVEMTGNSAKSIGAAVFMKDSLISVVGENNIRRELPKELRMETAPKRNN